MNYIWIFIRVYVGYEIIERYLNVLYENKILNFFLGNSF